MEFVDFFALILLLGLLGTGGYILWTYLPGETQELFRKPGIIEENITSLSNTDQFYPNMRYSSSTITYHIEEICDEKKTLDVLESFSIISESTPLRFVPSVHNPELEILCSEIAPTTEQLNHFIAGEGGPTTIINVTDFYVILKGKVSLYRSEMCDTPHISLHEILHAMGFDHNPNPRSIMFEVVSCKQTLDESIIEDINRLYAPPSLTDLSFEEITASKSGRYLNFYAGIMNKGLKDALDVSLKVIIDNEVVKEFSLGDIPLGTKKFLDVNNLQIARGTDEVEFVIETGTNQEELSMENNDEIFVLN